MRQGSYRRSLYFVAALIPASFALAGETALVGGSGGTSTVTMDCGSSAFIVGVSATGGKDTTFGFDLLRRIRFTCQPFSGTTPGTSTSLTTEARASKAASVNVSSDSKQCPSGSAIKELQLYAGMFIDQLDSAECRTPTGTQTFLSLDVGGSGGDRKFASCPTGEALYKVVARVGENIDSLKGYCRTFGGLSSQPAITQISESFSPDPSSSTPLKIAPGASGTIKFTVPSSGINDTFNIGVTGRTDLLGGGSLNPPEFRIDYINPSGATVVTKSFSKVVEGVIQSARITPAVSGVWKMKITNLKRDIGGLEITGAQIFK